MIRTPQNSGWNAVTSTSPRDEADLSSIDSTVDSKGSSIVTDLILSSPVYEQAYSVFYNDKSYGTPYLQQLMTIPYAHSVRDENFWDSVSNAFGATSGFEAAVQDAYNIALDEIRSLLSQYYAFRNSLPVEQVQQMAEAGVNAALTGEGITPSTMANEGVVSGTQPSQSQYSNDQLSQGVTSFVSFIDSLSQLTSVSFSSANLMGLLDIAEREALNKQETHDLLLAQLGITPSSSLSILNTDDNTVRNLIKKGSADARVAASTSSAQAAALDEMYDVPNLTSPDPSGSMRLSGIDVLNQVSAFAMVSRLGESYSQLNASLRNAQYSDILSTLDNEAAVAGAGANIAQGEFNSDYYNARNGYIEGSNESTISTRLSELKRLEIAQKEFDEMLSHYRQQTLGNWGEQINAKPHLAPFFYKALFDFGMTDTFYHQSALGQALKYGMENLNSISQIVGNIIGFKKVKPKVSTTRSTSTTSTPRGETITESLSETIVD